MFATIAGRGEKIRCGAELDALLRVEEDRMHA